MAQVLPFFQTLRAGRFSAARRRRCPPRTVGADLSVAGDLTLQVGVAEWAVLQDGDDQHAPLVSAQGGNREAWDTTLDTYFGRAEPVSTLDDLLRLAGEPGLAAT